MKQYFQQPARRIKVIAIPALTGMFLSSVAGAATTTPRPGSRRASSTKHARMRRGGRCSTVSASGPTWR